MSASFSVFPILAIVVAVLVAIRWRRGLFMALPFLVTLNGVPLSFGALSIRIDQLVACLLLIPLASAVLAGTRRLRLDRTSWFLIVLLATNIVASVLNSPVRAYSIAQCVNLGSAWVIYVLLINYLDGIQELEKFLVRVLWAAVVATSLAVAAFVLGVSGVNVGGAEVSRSAAENLTFAYGAFGTMFEPNILGSFSSANLVLATGVLVSSVHVREWAISRRLLRWVIALTATALVLSFTRAAWIGTLVGMLCLAVLGSVRLKVRVRASRVGFVAATLAVVLILLFLLPGDTGDLFRFKVANLINPASQTALVRLVTYGLAIEQALQHLIIGCGTFSYAALTAQSGDFQQIENWRGLWIGNYLLLAFHDTGVIGLALWIAMLGDIVRRPLRILRIAGPGGGESARRVLALTAALITFLVAFLATSGFSFGYSWLIVGLLAAYCRVFEEQRAVSTRAEEHEQHNG